RIFTKFSKNFHSMSMKAYYECLGFRDCELPSSRRDQLLLISGQLGLGTRFRQQDTRARTRAVNLGRWRPQEKPVLRPEVVGSNPTGPTMINIFIANVNFPIHISTVFSIILNRFRILRSSPLSQYFVFV